MLRTFVIVGEAGRGFELHWKRWVFGMTIKGLVPWYHSQMQVIHAEHFCFKAVGFFVDIFIEGSEKIYWLSVRFLAPPPHKCSLSRPSLEASAWRCTCKQCFECFHGHLFSTIHLSVVSPYQDAEVIEAAFPSTLSTLTDFFKFTA